MADWASIEVAVLPAAEIFYCTAVEPDVCSWSGRVTFDEVQTRLQDQVEEHSPPLAPTS